MVLIRAQKVGFKMPAGLNTIRNLLHGLDLRSVACDYCDVRIEEQVKTEISYRKGELQACDVKPSLGCFIRVYARGKWFYASSTDLNAIQTQLHALAAQALVFSPQ